MVQDAMEIKRKIISTIRFKGPGLPVQIARAIQMSPLFASAFLAELVSEKQLKMSIMKVGGSPLYLIPGQEPQLERFLEYIKGKEKEALLLLKNKKFLQDTNQEPAIRVALRAIRDFAIPFKHNDIIYWRYFTTPLSEFQPKPEKRGAAPKMPAKKTKPVEKQKLLVKEKPIIAIKPKIKKTKKIKEKSAFVQKVLKVLQIKDVELLEEIECKKKEFTGMARINSDLGKMELFVIAKDKKKITENDLTMAVHQSQSNRRIILFISPGEPDKKALHYLEKYKNLIKVIKIQ